MSGRQRVSDSNSVRRNEGNPNLTASVGPLRIGHPLTGRASRPQTEPPIGVCGRRGRHPSRRFGIVPSRLARPSTHPQRRRPCKRWCCSRSRSSVRSRRSAVTSSAVRGRRRCRRLHRTSAMPRLRARLSRYRIGRGCGRGSAVAPVVAFTRVSFRVGVRRRRAVATSSCDGWERTSAPSARRRRGREDPSGGNSRQCGLPRPSSVERAEARDRCGQAVQEPETRKRFVRVTCVMVGSSRQWVCRP